MDLLTASGDSTKQPQIGYYIVTMGEKTQVEQSELADSVAQAFLGTRIGCARCHNHPLEKFTQDDYYHFTPFFARLSNGSAAHPYLISVREAHSLFRSHAHRF